MKDQGYLNELKNNCIRKSHYTNKDLRRKARKLAEIIVKYSDEEVVQNRHRRHYTGNT